MLLVGRTRREVDEGDARGGAAQGPDWRDHHALATSACKTILTTQENVGGSSKSASDDVAINIHASRSRPVPAMAARPAASGVAKPAAATLGGAAATSGVASLASPLRLTPTMSGNPFAST